MRRHLVLLALYAVAAVLLLAPWRGLVGHPEIDVWNHVWGYWWVADSVAHAELPWRTSLMGAPTGGVLWYVDLVGAVVQLPVTAIFGPAVAYNAAMVGRVALAGLAGHLLAEALSEPGPHAAIGGVGFASAPSLLCELHNGISEVVAVHWVGFALLFAVRALRGGDRRAWAWLGLVGGASVFANFYYGLTSALLVGVAVVLHLRDDRGRWLDWRGPATALACALPLAVLALAALRASVAAPDALVRRSAELNAALAAHNAVDPRVYLMPGEFWSVDLMARYGEPFRHTGYLRLGAVALAGWALLRPGPARRWAIVAAASLVLGLGPYLWWDQAWVAPGGRLLLLPFGMLQRLVPELAITHPLRLAVGAQALVPAIAALALIGRARWQVGLAAAALVLETVLVSVAVWPVPASSTAVPPLYAQIAASDDPRAVLDLPAEVGTGMATSRYFWFQTVHGHPVPYKPDARGGSTGDPTTFRWFPQAMGPGGLVVDGVASLGEPQVAHLRSVYGWVILHRDLDARTASAGRLQPLLESGLGPGEAQGDLIVWRLGPSGAADPGARPAAEAPAPR